MVVNEEEDENDVCLVPKKLVWRTITPVKGCKVDKLRCYFCNKCIRSVKLNF